MLDMRKCERSMNPPSSALLVFEPADRLCSRSIFMDLTTQSRTWAAACAVGFPSQFSIAMNSRAFVRNSFGGLRQLQLDWENDNSPALKPRAASVDATAGTFHRLVENP